MNSPLFHARLLRPLATAVAAASLVAGLSACAPLLVGGAVVGSVMVASDRRSSGAQIDDQAIELKAMNRIREVFNEQRVHVNVTSYNRMVLLTGEVGSEEDKQRVERIVAGEQDHAVGVDNVRSIVNDLAVMGVTSLTSRSNDVILGGKVKATFVDARDLQAQAVKVIAERGTIYLMGRVTEREARRAAELARSVGGVAKVVTVFELITEEELARLQPNRPSPTGATPSQ
jgi:osmotically-inducible protein OsmY